MRAAWGLPVLRILDDSGKVLSINAEIPNAVETSLFKGMILPMVNCKEKHANFNTYHQHFDENGRKFEIQFQGKMKYIPTGEIMVGT
jgi:hypothetical protein